jgi:hypothetical protein
MFCLLCEIVTVCATWRETHGKMVEVMARQKLKRRLYMGAEEEMGKPCQQARQRISAG